MMLILTWQTALSQEVVIDTTRKTITLNREKKIDVAKIILNEKELYEENILLKEYIKGLEEENLKLKQTVDIATKDYLDLSSKLILKQEEIISKQEELANNKQKSGNNGFYLKSDYLTNNIGLGLGVSYVSTKMFYSASIFPDVRIENLSTKVYGFSVGLKLF